VKLGLARAPWSVGLSKTTKSWDPSPEKRTCKSEGTGGTPAGATILRKPMTSSQGLGRRNYSCHVRTCREALTEGSPAQACESATGPSQPQRTARRSTPAAGRRAQTPPCHLPQQPEPSMTATLTTAATTSHSPELKLKVLHGLAESWAPELEVPASSSAPTPAAVQLAVPL
jgi:hypothetical protein